MKNKIYFAASIRGGLNDREDYLTLIQHLKEYGEVLTEHLWLDEDAKDELSDEAIFERDVSWIEQADIVIAEVSTPSLGVGWEIATAEHLGKRTITLYNTNSTKQLSAMISGNRFLKKIEYTTLTEVAEKLKILL